MKRVLFMSCFIILVFGLSGCVNNKEGNIDVTNTITNMSQLPFDLTKLESSTNIDKSEPIFLSTKVEPNFEKFEVSIEDFEVTSINDNYFYDYTDERGAHVYKSIEDNSSLKSTEIEGGVQLLYTMENASSPNEFSLELNLSIDSSLIIDDNGQYYVLSSNGDIEAFIGQPWAVDSKGDFVDTHYEIQDNVIKQVIEYEGGNYLIQADPLFCNNTVNNGATVWDPDRSTSGGSLMVVPTTCARIYLIGMYINPFQTITLSMALNVPLISDMYSETVNDSDYINYITTNESGVLDQFVCHAYNPFATVKSSWNLEPWRPNVSL